jgi:cysteine desulfurase/selenocysteine lyase
MTDLIAARLDFGAFLAGTTKPLIADGKVYIGRVGLANIGPHEADVLAYATASVNTLPGVRVIGTARRKASILSFIMEDVHPHDIGTIVDREGVAIRTGHHCAQPVMDRFGIPASANEALEDRDPQCSTDADCQ